MIIEFLKPYSLNMGEDFEYVSTFIKGKDKLSLENCRILVKGLTTGKDMLIALENRDNFFGRPVNYKITLIKVSECITNDHLKGENKKYNYYRVGYDIRDVHTVLNAWRQADPMVHVGDLTHQFVSKIGNNYKGSYKFDNKIY